MGMLMSFLASRTVQGALIVVVSNALTAFGIPIGEEGLVEVVNHVVSIAGGVYAIYGRAKAKGPIVSR